MVLLDLLRVLSRFVSELEMLLLELGNFVVGFLELLVLLRDPFLQLVRSHLALLKLLCEAHDLLFARLA